MKVSSVWSMSSIGACLAEVWRCKPEAESIQVRIFQKEIKFLGYVVSEEGVKTDPKKT